MNSWHEIRADNQRPEDQRGVVSAPDANKVASPKMDIKNPKPTPMIIDGESLTPDGVLDSCEEALKLGKKPDRDSISKHLKQLIAYTTDYALNIVFIEKINQIPEIVRICNNRKVTRVFHNEMHSLEYSSPISRSSEDSLITSAMSAWGNISFRPRMSAGAFGDFVSTGACLITYIYRIVPASILQGNRLMVKKWMPLVRALNAGAFIFWLDDKNIYVAELPSICSLNDKNELHNTQGPAFKWLSDVEQYRLNGVLMQKHHIMLSSHELDPQECLSEPNVEVRRELIRKIGIELLLDKLEHALLDKDGNYELLSINLPGIVNDARYLKMLNPSIDVFHLEGVELECNTVQEAINWRAGNILPKGMDWKPVQLT